MSGTLCDDPGSKAKHFAPSALTTQDLPGVSGALCWEQEAEANTHLLSSHTGIIITLPTLGMRTEARDTVYPVAHGLCMYRNGLKSYTLKYDSGCF